MQLQARGGLSPLRFQMRGRRDDHHPSRSFGEHHPCGHERKRRLASTRCSDGEKVRLAIAQKATQRCMLPRPKPHAATRALLISVALPTEASALPVQVRVAFAEQH